MMQTDTAAERLNLGDEVDRLTREADLTHATEQLGISRGLAQKARWLAHAYRPAERVDIGMSCLQVLSPSHLEVAFQAGPSRVDVLNRAVAESLSVRETHSLARRLASRRVAEDGLKVIGGASDLVSALASLTRYVEWDDTRLAVLLAGPNGNTIRTLALAGRALSDRLGLAG